MRGLRNGFDPEGLLYRGAGGFLGVPLEADVEDGMKEQQKSKNYAVAPIFVSNPHIGTGARARGCFFYDVASDGDGQPRSRAQLVGAYTHTDRGCGKVFWTLLPHNSD